VVDVGGAHYTHSYQLNLILRFLIIAFLCRYRARLSCTTCPTDFPTNRVKKLQGRCNGSQHSGTTQGPPIQGASQQPVSIAYFTTARRFPALGYNFPTRYSSYHPLSLSSPDSFGARELRMAFMSVALWPTTNCAPHLASRFHGSLCHLLGLLFLQLDTNTTVELFPQSLSGL